LDDVLAYCSVSILCRLSVCFYTKLLAKQCLYCMRRPKKAVQFCIYVHTRHKNNRYRLHSYLFSYIDGIWFVPISCAFFNKVCKKTFFYRDLKWKKFCVGDKGFENPFQLFFTEKQSIYYFYDIRTRNGISYRIMPNII
jgi:hypothetical protein